MARLCYFGHQQVEVVDEMLYDDAMRLDAEVTKLVNADMEFRVTLAKGVMQASAMR